jgi:hypothetical protein
MPARREWILLAVLLTAPMAMATGNVNTDWDERAVALVQPRTVFPPPDCASNDCNASPCNV